MNKKTYRILALVLALAMGLGVAGIALADATFRPSSGTAYATDAVNVRSGPGTSYTVLGYLSRGEKVTITGTVSNGWTQIQLPGNRLGYVSSAYLSASYPSGGCVIVTPSGGDRYKVDTGALNVRSGPGTNYRVIAVLERGDIVTRIGQSGKWFKVSTSNGADAWVSSKYLSSVDGTVVIPGDSVTMYATTGVNVRSGPSTSYSVLGTVGQGQLQHRGGPGPGRQGNPHRHQRQLDQGSLGQWQRLCVQQVFADRLYRRRQQQRQLYQHLYPLYHHPAERAFRPQH